MAIKLNSKDPQFYKNRAITKYAFDDKSGAQADNQKARELEWK